MEYFGWDINSVAQLYRCHTFWHMRPWEARSMSHNENPVINISYRIDQSHETCEQQLKGGLQVATPQTTALSPSISKLLPITQNFQCLDSDCIWNFLGDLDLVVTLVRIAWLNISAISWVAYLLWGLELCVDLWTRASLDLAVLVLTLDTAIWVE